MAAEKLSFSDQGITTSELPLDNDAGEYSLNKQRLNRIRVASTPDLMENYYKILFNEPIAEYSSKFADAYAVGNIENARMEELYALVLKKEYPVRVIDINQLTMKMHPNFCCILSSQLVEISSKQESFFCMIIQKPRGISLREYVKNKGPFSEKLLIDSVLPAINNVLDFLYRFQVSHGCINPDNIYITENKEICVRECVSEPSGYSQIPSYEKIDRIILNDPVTKGSGGPNSDLFAFGMLTVYLHTGEDYFSGMSIEDIIRIKFEKTSYGFIIDKYKFSQHLIDLLRGTLIEEKNNSWSVEQNNIWFGGKVLNLLAPSPIKESTRGIVFLDRRFSSRKELAYYMWKNWDDAKEFIRSKTLLSWMEHNVKEPALAERMESVFKRSGAEDVGVKGFDRDDILLIEYLMILDPNGPLRIKKYAFNIDGIASFFASEYFKNEQDRKDASNVLRLILRQNLIQTWNDLCYVLAEGKGHSAIQNLLKCREIYYKQDKGFGMIRCLYELNSGLCCQSNIIKKNNCLTIYHFLQAIENTKGLDPNEIIDEHMWSFLASKLELTVNVKLSKLQKYPELMSNKSIQVLSILSLAQEASDYIPLPRLSGLFMEGLQTVVNLYHGRNIRNELKGLLNGMTSNGNLSRLLKTITDTKFILRDKIGFKRAVKRYQLNKLNMLRLSNSQAVYKVGYRYGLQLSVILSFLVASMTVVVLMSKAIF